MTSSFQSMNRYNEYKASRGSMPNLTADQSFVSKYRPVQEKRTRENDYFSSTNNAAQRSSAAASSNSQRIIPQAISNLQPTHSISMMSNRGIDVTNSLRGYTNQRGSAHSALAQRQPILQPNSLFSHAPASVLSAQNIGLTSVSDTYAMNLAQNINHLNQASLPTDQELLRREQIKEQNLQEKMLIAQKEQKQKSEVEQSFKQMSRLLEACLKLDETGAGITSTKQNDYYLPHGSQFIQYKSIEFPPQIVSYYNQQVEIFNNQIAVNKGIIQELNLAWVSISSRLFIWKYAPQSFASFTRIKDKNEHYRQGRDKFGVKRDERLERDSVKEFDFEEVILSVAYGQPKHAIFKQNEIKNVLVVAFPTQVKVKHLKIEANLIDIQDINVSIGTDHELVNQVVFSKRGRIFYGGSSGFVKHVDYFRQQLLGFTISQKFKAKEGVKWQQKLKQQLPFISDAASTVIGISVDDTRQILYALVEISLVKPLFTNPFAFGSSSAEKTKAKSTWRVDVYDLGVFDDDFKLVAQLSHAEFCEQLLSNSKNNFRLLPTDQELALVSVAAVEKTASADSHFVVVTQSGIRAYFSMKTVLATDRNGVAMGVQSCKEAKEKFAMFERYRPTGEFKLSNVKGMIEIPNQQNSFRSLNVFYDQKGYAQNRGQCLQIDEERRKQIKSVFHLRGGAMVMQKIESNNTHRLICVETNSCFIARQKENMFINHQIFADLLPQYAVATERVSEIVLDFYASNASSASNSLAHDNTGNGMSFSRDEHSNMLSDLTLSQIPEKALLPSSVSNLISANGFEQLDANQMIGESAGGQLAFACMSDLVKQCYSPPAHYVILTSRGILLNYQQRPIDILYQVIRVLPEIITESPQTPAQILQQQQQLMHKQNNPQQQHYRLTNQDAEKMAKSAALQKLRSFEFFEQFILTYGVTETFAMLSQMLCHSHLEYYQNLNLHNHLDKMLKSKMNDGEFNLTQTFVQGTQFDRNSNKDINGLQKAKQSNGFEADPTAIPETIISEISQPILKKALFLFQKYGNILLDGSSENDNLNNKRESEFANTLGKAWEWTRKKYSSKVEGILLYFSRLIRPVWNRSLVNTSAFKFFVNEPIENFKRDEIQVFTRRISEFKFWLEEQTKLLYTSAALSSDSGSLKFMSGQDQSFKNQFGDQQYRFKNNEEKLIEIKAEEARVVDDLQKLCGKIIQIANLFLFICENKLRQNLNNVDFKYLRDDLLNLRFKDLFSDRKFEKIIKDYVLQAIKLDPKYMEQARLVLTQFNLVFNERDFNISQAEIKLQVILTKLLNQGNKATSKYLNECTNIILEHIEYLTIDYLERFNSIYSALDSRIDFVRILLECIKFHQRILENIERSSQETLALEEQLRAGQSYNPINKYSEQLKISKQIAEDNAQQRDFCLKKLLSILEDLHKESLASSSQKVIKDQQLSSIIQILRLYPLEQVHAAVIDLLLQAKRNSDILELNSPFTETLFASLGGESADCLKIKFKYYEKKGNIREAYKIAYQISNYVNREDSPDDFVVLEDRIDFTDIALYNVSLIIDDFHVSSEDKQQYILEKDFLLSQLKVLRVQKRIYDKLHQGLTLMEENLKKTKDAGKKKSFEEQKQAYKESYDVLKFFRFDEAMLEQYFIKPLNLVEYSLVLYDLIPEDQIPVNIPKLYENLINRMSDKNNFEYESWPQNIQLTLQMLNDEISNKNKLICIQTIILNSEDKNSQLKDAASFGLKNFLDLYSGLLSGREDANSKLLKSPLWLPHFLVTELKFSPLLLLSIYYPIQGILKQELQNEQVRKYIQLSNCVFLLLRHTISYIADVLQHHQEKSKELIQVRSSVAEIEKILDIFNNDSLRIIKEFSASEQEYIQYQQQFVRIYEDLQGQIGEIESLEGDYQMRGSGAAAAAAVPATVSAASFMSDQNDMSIGGMKGVPQFVFDPDMRKVPSLSNGGAVNQSLKLASFGIGNNGSASKTAMFAERNQTGFNAAHVFDKSSTQNPKHSIFQDHL